MLTKSGPAHSYHINFLSEIRQSDTFWSTRVFYFLTWIWAIYGWLLTASASEQILEAAA